MQYLWQAGRSRIFTFFPSKTTFGLGCGNFIKWTVQAPARPFGGKGIPIESASRAKGTGQKPPQLGQALARQRQSLNRGAELPADSWCSLFCSHPPEEISPHTIRLQGGAGGPKWVGLTSPVIRLGNGPGQQGRKTHVPRGFIGLTVELLRSFHEAS